MYDIIVPYAPTTQPVLASLKATPYKLLVVPLTTFVQEVPSYFKIVPPSPTAYPFVALVKYTDLKLFVTPLVTEVQFVPLYLKIVPDAPTAQPVVESNNCTANNSFVPCVEVVQVEPLYVMILPEAPTIMPLFVPKKDIPFKLAVTEVFETVAQLPFVYFNNLPD